jgi:hypothetical protein
MKTNVERSNINNNNNNNNKLLISVVRLLLLLKTTRTTTLPEVAAFTIVIHGGKTQKPVSCRVSNQRLQTKSDSLLFIRTRDFGSTQLHLAAETNEEEESKPLQLKLQQQQQQPATTTTSSTRITQETRWHDFYQKLVEFKNIYGHCRVPQGWKDDPRLGVWVTAQRSFQAKGTLREDREAKLNELQFDWSGHVMKWDASFQKLVEFKTRFGHCDVPAIWKEDPTLGVWVARQRHLKSTGRLQPDREAKLNEIKFAWNEQDIKWDTSFQKLVKFKSRFGHCDVPQYWKEDPALGKWVNKQRVLHSKGTLQPDREVRLNELQFSWSKQDIKWDVSFQKLVEFKTRFGNCDVPQYWEEDPALGSWVARQRVLESKGRLQPDRQARLNELQFTARSGKDIEWNILFQNLVEFKSRFGHCNVPQGWKEDRFLGRWVTYQRESQLKGTLKPDREARLNELQFTWKRADGMPKNEKWDASYQKLVKFKRRFGHCDVAQRWKEDPALGKWVVQQRHLKSKGTLKPNRKAKLEELQFSWSEQLSLAAKNNWDASYQKLVEFKSRFGHCRVPQGWKEDPLLGLWVAYQRRLKAMGKLESDREAMLNEIQFTWDAQNVKWDVFFQKLVEFRSRFGHSDVPQNWKEDPTLGIWVRTQRALESRGALQPDRKAKLDELQFTWRSQGSRVLASKASDAKWNICFDRLVRFKHKYGHCDVPRVWKEDPPLGHWVMNQRRLKTTGKLKPDREAKLNELQFTWSVSSEKVGMRHLI